jgi:hypothetical protein
MMNINHRLSTALHMLHTCECSSDGVRESIGLLGRHEQHCFGLIELVAEFCHSIRMVGLSGGGEEREVDIRCSSSSSSYRNSSCSNTSVRYSVCI